MRRGYATKSSGDLGGYVARHLAPRDAAVHGVGERDHGIEVLFRDRAGEPSISRAAITRAAPRGHRLSFCEESQGDISASQALGQC